MTKRERKWVRNDPARSLEAEIFNATEALAAASERRLGSPVGAYQRERLAWLKRRLAAGDDRQEVTT